MAVNAADIRVGGPDQATTGAVLSAPVGTAAPTDAVTALNVAFTDSGYVSEDGVEVAPDVSTSDIRDMSGAVVRKIIETFDGTISWAHLETNEKSLNNYFGEDNVTATAANGTHGTQLAATLGAYDLPRKAWAFKIKDGDARMLVYVPDGNVTSREPLTLNKRTATTWGVTLTTYPDANGHNIYIFTDDGVLAV